MDSISNYAAFATRDDSSLSLIFVSSAACAPWIPSVTAFATDSFVSSVTAHAPWIPSVTAHALCFVSVVVEELA
jgi:hypothetical protein